jgi:acetolactate synthase small subunit
MNIETLTIAQAREIAALFNTATPTDSSTGFKIGQNYQIRTVTMIYTGRVVQVSHHEVIIEDAAWIADTGRFSNALRTGSYSEVEPYPDGKVIIGRASIVDAAAISTLPRSQK